MKRILVGILIAAMLILAIPATAGAATYEDITVTATPEYISIDVSPTTWTLNGIHGSSVIATNTTYYADGGSDANDTTAPSSTVLAGECQFTITNDSTVNINVVADMEDFSGGDADMTNSETGSNGATSYGAYSWYCNMTYSSKVVVKTNGTGSDTMWTTSTPGEDNKFGIEVTTQTDAWTGGSSSTSTLKISATAA